jgi:hypothetical protein
MADRTEQILSGISDLRAEFCEFRGEVKTELSAIKEQTTKTNGTVKSHDAWINQQKGERRAMGIVGGFIGSIGTAIAMKIFKL